MAQHRTGFKAAGRAAVIAVALSVASAPLPVFAQAEGATETAPEAAGRAIFATLRLPDLIAVMREEGLKAGRELDETFLGSAGGPRFAAEVARIYTETSMREMVEAAVVEELAKAPEHLPAIADFFGSDLGQRIVSLEVEARRAFLDEAVEDAAKVAFGKLSSDNSDRADRLRAFDATNDFLERNVAGALTANLAFYQGLNESGALGSDVPEDQLLSDVYGQEPQIRADLEGWLFAYLTLAYEPLSDAEIDSYVAFSATPAGQHLNAALFAGFDRAFVGLSRSMGSAAGRAMLGSDI